MKPKIEVIEKIIEMYHPAIRSDFINEDLAKAIADALEVTIPHEDDEACSCFSNGWKSLLVRIKGVNHEVFE